MGAWGCGAFDNDDSGDWLDLLQQASDASVIADALQHVASFGEEYLEEPYSSYAIAAAEIVAALFGHPVADFDETAQEWVNAHRSLAVTGLVPTALAALQRIRTNSELKELWDDSPGAAHWYAVLDDISRRLSAK